MDKKVVIYGYVNNNLGDDLFFEYLASRYPSIDFEIYVNKKYLRTFQRIENLKIREISFFKRLLRKFINKKIDLYSSNKTYDVSITIGGSIFMEKGLWRNEHEIYKRRIQKNGNNVIIGANFGPYFSEEFLEKYKEAFLLYDDICFRDKYSHILFKENEQVRYAADILFGYPQIKNELVLKKIFVSVIKPSFREELNGLDNIYYEGIKKICVNYIKKGYIIELVSFCKAEGDERAVDKIYEKFNIEEKKYVEKLFYNGENRKSILESISSSEMIVATRFHAMILGWVHNKKVLPIIYSNKILNVIKDTNFEGMYIDLRNSNETYEVKNEYIKTLEYIDEKRKESIQHFNYLDEILN